ASRPAASRWTRAPATTRPRPPSPARRRPPPAPARQDTHPATNAYQPPLSTGVFDQTPRPDAPLPGAAASRNLSQLSYAHRQLPGNPILRLAERSPRLRDIARPSSVAGAPLASNGPLLCR